jgi:hypothetical protein
MPQVSASPMLNYSRVFALIHKKEMALHYFPSEYICIKDVFEVGKLVSCTVAVEEFCLRLNKIFNY